LRPSLAALLQLEQIKASGGAGGVENGMVSVDKPLAQVLQENKERKDAEFQEKLKIIKQGGWRTDLTATTSGRCACSEPAWLWAASQRLCWPWLGARMRRVSRHAWRFCSTH
jgi:hypothetical protein